MMTKSQNTNSELLSLLVCPDSLSGLIYDKSQSELVSLRSRLAFPIQDGVPFMMTEAARQIGDVDIMRLRAASEQFDDDVGKR